MTEEAFVIHVLQNEFDMKHAVILTHLFPMHPFSTLGVKERVHWEQMGYPA